MAPEARKLWKALPIATTLRGYRPARFTRDLAAGVAVGSMVVPQGLAFAELAGMRPVTGLWAAMVGFVAYALFGPSRQLIVGPEAGTSIMTLAVIAPLGLQGAASEAAAGALALMVAVLLFIGGLARIGALTDFLSRPILLGYLNGIGFVLIASQLAGLLGLEREENDFIPQLVEVAQSLGGVHMPTVWLSVATIALLLLMDRFTPRIPGPVVALIATIGLSAWLGFEEMGISVVGDIQRGFPAPTLPAVELGTLFDLAPGALGMALLAFSSSVLTSQGFADKRGYPTRPNAEFFGLGAANLLSGFFQGFPVAASTSRTAVNDSSGGRTQVAALIASVVLLAVLLFLTPLFAHLPNATLGAVVIVAAISLFDPRGVARLWNIRTWEGVLALLATAGVLIFGILQGIVIAVVLSLGALIRQVSRPHDAVQGRIEGRPGFHDVNRRPEAQSPLGLMIYRLDGPLFFANARFVKEQVRDLVTSADEPVRMLILDAGGIFDMDPTAARMLRKLYAELEEWGTTLVIAEPHAPLRKALRRSGLLAEIGKKNLYPTVRAAVEAYEKSQEDGRDSSR